MEAASTIISETDLVLTALALRFCTTLLRQQRTLGPQVTQRVLPQALTLIKSPMLQVGPLSPQHLNYFQIGKFFKKKTINERSRL